MMRLGAFIQALLAAALFGMATPFSKTLLSGLQENQLAGLLYLGAAVFLAPGMLRARRRGAALPAGDRRNQLYLLGAIFFGGIVGPVLLLLGLRFSQAASVSMWLNLETVATAVLAALLFKEHLGKWTWLGTAGVVLSGALLSVQGGRAGVMGILCVGGACIAWGLDNNFTASIDAITPQASTFWKGLVAGTTNLAIGLTFFLWQPGWDWVWALALGGVSYGASIVLYIASAQRLGAARSQMVFASSPFFGVLLSVIWLGETLSPIQIAAAFILAGSVGLMLLERHEHE
ncbi:MAG TPA: DMT family transporter, partial [Candidatus Hydrogenedentes bacterium]|nr:DMT family transporter [Candidatus Hydrogenedentota bacterium]